MLLIEELANAQIPRSRAERQKQIAAQEKVWMALPWDRTRYTPELASQASILLSAIAFSDLAQPVDLSLLSDDNNSSARSSEPTPAPKPPTNGKRKRENSAGGGKGSKKAKKSGASHLTPRTQVACLDRKNGSQWILGRISRYLPEVKKYEVVDEADGEDTVYRVAKKNIKVLPKRASSLDPKKKVLAVYPQTTVFYPARLINRKGKNWVVEFDDEDETEEKKFKEIDGRYIITE